MPSEVQEVVTSVGENIAQERYEQIYNEASDLWKKGRHARTVERSVQDFENEAR